MNSTKAALVQAIRESDLTIREKMALRLALVFHADKVDAVVKDTLEASSMSIPTSDITDGVGKQDWAAIIKFFIENVLPLLLKLLA